MSVEEITQLKQRLVLYLEAEQKILSGAQEYSIGEGGGARRVRRGDLQEVRDEIRSINERIQQLLAMGFSDAGATRRRRIVYPNY